MSLLAPAELGWPVLTIGRRRPVDADTRPDELPIAELRFGDEVAELWLSDTESLRLTRSPLAVMFTTRTPLSDDMVAHPFIALPAAVCSRWHDRQILHGGGVVVGGVAWAILGTKEAGKSSTLGWLAAQGFGIVSDDILVLSDNRVFAGPRSVDLREETAARLGGERIEIQAGRERWRLRPPAVPGSLPLGGLVHLAWADDLSIEAVPVIERLGLLIDNSVLGPTLADSTAYLELAALPTLRFRRPRRIDGLDAAMTHLVGALEG